MSPETPPHSYFANLTVDTKIAIKLLDTTKQNTFRDIATKKQPKT